MTFLKSVVNEFKARRLWLVAVGLVAVMAAVPMLLSSSPAVPAPLAPPVPPASATASALPILNTQSASAAQPVKGNQRDPFAPLPGAGAKKTQTAASAVAKTVSSIATSLAGRSTTTSTTTPHASGSQAPAHAVTPSSPSGSSRTPAPRTPVSQPSGGHGSGSPPVSRPLHRIPGGTTGNTGPGGTPPPDTSPLAPRQAFVVAASVSSAGGSVEAIDPLVRNSVLPNAQNPALVLLGVLKGGQSVLFAVAANATVSGPGTCTPGLNDCEVVSLPIDTSGAPETVSLQLPSGSTLTQSISITDIRRQKFPTKAAANRARSRTDHAGASVLATWTQPALSLFSWDDTGGYLADQRDLGVSGQTG